MNTSLPPPLRTKAGKRRIPARSVFTDLGCFLGFGFGAGLAPVAPGTFGTLVAIPVYLALRPLDVVAYSVAVLFLFLLGIPICQRTENRIGVSDHSGIVWDEIVGYLITLAAVPSSWENIVAGFMLFRLFDIFKPWPIRLLDRSLHGGLGIMLDDAVAGIFAAIGLYALQPYLHWS